MPRRQQKAAKKLGYKARKWNDDDNSDLDDVEWDDLNRKQKRYARTLGFNEDEWNEWFCEDDESTSDSDSDDYRRGHRHRGKGGVARHGRHGGGAYLADGCNVHLTALGLGDGR